MTKRRTDGARATSGYKEKAMKKNHVHKYERRRLGSWKKSGHEIYKCVLPGCTHYMMDMELVIGRFSECWGGCGNHIVMTRDIVFNEKRKWPMCENCKAKKREQRERLQELTENATIDTQLETK